jgi:hypothetical protein
VAGVPAQAATDARTAMSAGIAVLSLMVRPLDSPTLGESNHAEYCGRRIALADILHAMQKIVRT